MECDGSKSLGSKITELYRFIKSSNVRQGLWDDMIADIDEKQTYSHIRQMINKIIFGAVEDFQYEPTDSTARRHSLSELSIMAYTVDTVLAEILHSTYQNQFRDVVTKMIQDSLQEVEDAEEEPDFSPSPSGSLPTQPPTSNSDLNTGDRDDQNEPTNQEAVPSSLEPTLRKKGRPKKKSPVKAPPVEAMELDPETSPSKTAKVSSPNKVDPIKECNSPPLTPQKSGNSSANDIASHSEGQEETTSQTADSSSPVTLPRKRGRPSKQTSEDPEPEFRPRPKKISILSPLKKRESLKALKLSPIVNSEKFVPQNDRKFPDITVASHSGDEKEPIGQIAASSSLSLQPRKKGRPAKNTLVKPQPETGLHETSEVSSPKKVDSLKVPEIDINSRALIPQNQENSPVNGIASDSISHSNDQTSVAARGRPRKGATKQLAEVQKGSQNNFDPVVRLALLKIPEGTSVIVSPKTIAETKMSNGNLKRKRGRPIQKSKIAVPQPGTSVTVNSIPKDEGAESDAISELSIESVSSVRTSELSSFEDNVSVGSNEEDTRHKKTVPLKIAQDLYKHGQLSQIYDKVTETQGPARKVTMKKRKSKPLGSKVQKLGKIRKSTKTTVPNSLASRGKRVRKPNSKYFSDSVFHSSKNYLGQHQEYTETTNVEQEKTPVEDTSFVDSPRRASRTPTRETFIANCESLGKTSIQSFPLANTSKRYESSDLYKPRVASRRIEA